jgi:hypothetical protein
MKYDSFGSLRTAVQESGSHWFDTDAMRFFGTRFPSGKNLWGGRIFIASHEYPDGFDENGFDKTKTVWQVHYVSRGDGGAGLTIANVMDWEVAPTDRVEAERVAEYVAVLDLPEVETYESAKSVEAKVASWRLAHTS